MQISIGTSEKANVQAAVDEVVAKAGNPNLLVLLCAYEHLKDASSMISKQFPNVPFIGTSVTSYYDTVSSDKRMILMAFGKDVDAEVGVLRNLSTSPMEDIAYMERVIQKVGPGKDNTICIEFCTNDEERLVSTMNVALEKGNIPLVGGTIFGLPEGATAYAMVNGVLYPDACCYAIIKNKSGKIRTYSELIYGPKECPVSHIATKVDLEHKGLVSLDGRPAADIYCEDAGVSRSEIVNNVLVNPFGRVVGDEIFISSPYEVGANGSLLSYKKINENDTIQVLELKDYEAIGAQTRKQIRDENSKISLVFSVNCIYRHLLYTNKNYLTQFLSEMKNVGLHVGVVGGGEQHNKQHVNQTMVCAVFE
ncbi:MAG: FIST C-terminal domain-containing protein [Pseudobutyrivibrio sp.]|nr:FIST C-terminal domain-containing protein [Pseudobutyrivibrio sp.]